MEARHFFENNQTFQKIHPIFKQLIDEKNKLDEEVELEKIKNPQNLDSTLTEKKHQAITDLLNNFKNEINEFNSLQVNGEENDQTAEFWFAVKLACHVKYTIAAHFYTLMEYRSYGKPIVGSLITVGLAGLTFFATPLISIISMLTLVGGIKLINSKTTSYMGLPTSFAIVANLSDTLLEVLNDLLPQATLPSNYDISASYKILELDPSASLEQIEKRKSELDIKYKEILRSLRNKDTSNCHEQTIHTAQDVAKVIMASFIALVHQAQNDKSYHLRVRCKE